jgi:hypothetical protein
VVAREEIKHLKARRDHAVDMKDWALFERLHAPDHMSHNDGYAPWNTAAELVANVVKSLEGVTTVHHSHTPNIEFEAPTKAKGVWAMEDYLSWKQGEEDHWLRGYGFYHETYEKRDGQWVFTFRRLQRLRVDLSPGAVFGPKK